MNFTKEPTPISGAFVIKHDSFTDERGSFCEIYRKDVFDQLGLPTFQQVNSSHSDHGVLRGMHIQTKNPQGKLVKVLVGEIFDVGVDLRPDSPTFKRHYGKFLSAEGGEMLYFPPGIAHGFQCTSRVCVVQYLCTTIYDRETDGGIAYNDQEIGIDWPLEPKVVSDKDSKLPSAMEWLERENKREQSK